MLQNVFKTHPHPCQFFSAFFSFFQVFSAFLSFFSVFFSTCKRESCRAVEWGFALSLVAGHCLLVPISLPKSLRLSRCPARGGRYASPACLPHGPFYWVDDYTARKSGHKRARDKVPQASSGRARRKWEFRARSKTGHSFGRHHLKPNPTLTKNTRKRARGRGSLASLLWSESATVRGTGRAVRGQPGQRGKAPECLQQ